MLMCMCVNLISRASRWYSDSNSTCSLNSFIIKSIWMFSEHHNSLFNIHWTSSQMLIQMFNEHLIQHQWRYTTNCQKIALRALQALWVKLLCSERALSGVLALWAKMSLLMFESGLPTCRCMKRVCQLLKIVQRMFTAYHSETYRTTEQMNQNVEMYICTFLNYSQNNWASLLLMTELVINNHDFSSTEVSLFFLFHEYYMKPLQLLQSWSLYDLWKVQYRKLIKLYRRWKKSQSEHR
jgi:hypothetical protein